MVEIIIDAEVLIAVDSLIKLYCELVAVIRLHRYRHQGVADGRGRNKLKQVDCSRVHAGQRNDVTGEKNRIGAIVRYGGSRTQPGYASSALIERVGVDQRAGKRGFPRKIRKSLRRAGTFRKGWDSHGRRLDPLPDAAPFIRCEEEGVILDYRPAKSSAELILVELRLRATVRGEAVGVSIENLVAKEFVYVAVELIRA